MSEQNNIRQMRIEKLKKLRELGIDPYPAVTHRAHTIAQALAMEGEIVAIAGRIISYREHGNIAFADIEDESGKIQIFFQKTLLGNDRFKQLKLLDIGDFIQVEGEVVKTVAGETSVAPTSYQLLTKSLLPLPSEWYGLKDVETKLRKRYLDLIINEDVKELFRKKTTFWETMRSFLIEKGFLEVDMPVLQIIPGGADARPFITHHHAHDIDLYLRISLELPLKKLLVGGFEKVFEIGPVFRNEGIDDEHLQDYRQLEFYWAYANYNDLMGMVQDMYQTIVRNLFGKLTTTWNGQEIDWSGQWPRIDYTELLDTHWGVDTASMTVDDLYELAKKLNVKVEPNLGKGRLLDYIYKKTIRPELIQPMFVLNHPVEVEPLAKRIPEDLDKVQRMQVLALGTELGKGFSELNDPIDQRERFEEQAKLRNAGDEEAQMMDDDFVEALEHGMPPAAGFGVSERLFSMLVDKPIREMVFFPIMKPEKMQKAKDSTHDTLASSYGSSKNSKISLVYPRDEAYALLTQYISSEALIRHCLAAEAAMRGIYNYLHKNNYTAEEENVWGVTGLLHDIDYEIAQKENKLDKHGILLFETQPDLLPEPITHAIEAHNYWHTGVNPESDLDWAITNVDQLTGLINSTALIQPDKELASVTVESVMKKFNNLSFSKGVDRENIKQCETTLGIPLEKFIEITLSSMQAVADTLGFSKVIEKTIAKPEQPKEQDFSRKLVIVINKELPTWQAMNTLAHASAYLGNKMDTSFDTGEVFVSQDNHSFPRNTQYPIIALSAEQKSLPKLLEKVKASGLLYHAFIREMIETTNDKEIESELSKKTADQVEILGIGIFGPNDEVDKLTKGYSLWK